MLDGVGMRPPHGFFLSTVILLGSCCLSEATLTPRITKDPASGKRVAAEMVTNIKFAPCCPSGRQRNTAARIQDSLAQAYQKAITGEMTLETYERLRVLAE